MGLLGRDRWEGPRTRICMTSALVLAGVTAAQVCTPGWSETHRDVPEQRRYAVFAEYGLSYSVHDAYEVDHLVSVAATMNDEFALVSTLAA